MLDNRSAKNVRAEWKAIGSIAYRASADFVVHQTVVLKSGGAIDPEVAKAWARFDVKKKLSAEWPTLGKKLKGKIHLACGADDNFHLDVPMRRTCGTW